MKTASIIFLCLALVIAGCGFILCKTAENRAAADGVELFTIATDENGNRVSVIDYDTSKMEKINIALKKGTVNIREGDECRVEIYNLMEGAYIKGISTNVLQINDTLNPIEIVKEGGLGISFSGIRNLLHELKPFTYDKWINVYVPKGTPLNAIEVRVLDGTINVEGLEDIGADLLFTAENGAVNVKNCSANSRLQITGKKADIALSGGFASDLRVSTEHGSVALASGFSFVKADLRVTGEGNVDVALTQSISRFALGLSASEDITLNGTSLGTKTYTAPGTGMTLTATTARGKLSVTD